jgi:hypothetical protein
VDARRVQRRDPSGVTQENHHILRAALGGHRHHGKGEEQEKFLHN